MDALHTAWPIIQAPMAGSQDEALALAVSETGALGSLPCAMLGVEALERALRALAARTSSPINLNFFCHVEPAVDAARERAFRAALEPYYRELGVDADDAPSAPRRAPFSAHVADVLEPHRPAVVSFHFGLPAPSLVARLKRWGTTILATATTVAEARWLEEHGADAIIAQGAEAGGHRGMFLTDDPSTQVGTLALVPRVVRAVRVPVIAAGGIVDAQGVAAARALGAAAVQVGTAYLRCPEATTSAVHRAALAGPAAEHTAFTNLFTGRPARGIVNRLMRELGPLSALAPAFPRASLALSPLRARAESLGVGDFSPLWAGQGAPLCRDVSARAVTEQLVAGL